MKNVPLVPRGADEYRALLAVLLHKLVGSGKELLLTTEDITRFHRSDTNYILTRDVGSAVGLSLISEAEARRQAYQASETKRPFLMDGPKPK